MNRMLLGTWAAVCIFTLTASAQSPNGWPRAGVYEGDGITVDLRPSKFEHEYVGSIRMDGEEFPIKAADDEVKGFSGVFSYGGKQYGFTMRFARQGVTLVTGETEYRLTPRAADGGGDDNPLARRNKQRDPEPRRDDPPRKDNQAGEGGIGVAFEADDDGNFIVRRVLKGGPAWKVGVQEGDILVSVNGRRVKGMTHDQLATMTRGPIGSNITIVISRDGNPQTLQFQRGSLDPEVIRREMEDELDEDDFDADGDDMEADAGGIQMIKHPTGALVVGKPRGWGDRWDERNRTLTFTDPETKTYVEYAFYKGVGFKSGREFYERGLKPSLEQNRVKILREDDFDLADRDDAYAVMFESTKGTTGIFALLMVTPGGDGVLFHFEGPSETIGRFEKLMLMLAESIQITGGGGAADDGGRSDQRMDGRERNDRRQDEARRDDRPMREDVAIVHPEHAPRGWRVLDTRNATGRVLVAKGLRGRDAREVLLAAVDALGDYFDARPQVTAGFIDTASGQAQALFAARIGKALARGHLTANPDGSVGVIYDSPANLERSFRPLMREMLAQAPELTDATEPLEPVRFPDGSGTMKLPHGFRITETYQGYVAAAGPRGEVIELGKSMQIMTGIDPMGIAPPMEGPLTAPLPRNLGEAMQSAVKITNNLIKAGGGTGQVQLVRIIESAPVDLGPQFNAALVLAVTAYHQPGEKSIQYLAYGLVSYAIIDAGQWIYYISSIAAPVEEFQAAAPAMLQAWQSWKVDDRVLFERIRKASESMRETTKIIMDVTRRRQEAMEKGMPAWNSYIRDTTTVVDSRTGKIEEKSNFQKIDDPNNIDPETGKPKQTDTDIKKWMEEENRKAGHERYKELDPVEARNRR